MGCKPGSAMMVAHVLVYIGALNMGLAALGYDVLNMLFGSMPMVMQVLYLAIGAAALYCLIKMCMGCKK